MNNLIVNQPCSSIWSVSLWPMSESRGCTVVSNLTGSHGSQNTKHKPRPVKNRIWTAHHFFISESVCYRKLDYWTRAVSGAAALPQWILQTQHGKLKQGNLVELGAAQVSGATNSPKILRSLTAAAGSGVSVQMKVGIGPPAPLEWPLHAVTPLTSGTPLITKPIPQSSTSILAFPFAVSSIIHDWRVCSVCTLTRALIHQGSITWEPPVLRAIPGNCSVL